MLYFTAQVSITVLSRNNHSGLPYPIPIENTFYNIPLFSRTFAKTCLQKCPTHNNNENPYISVQQICP